MTLSDIFCQPANRTTLWHWTESQLRFNVTLIRFIRQSVWRRENEAKPGQRRQPGAPSSSPLLPVSSFSSFLPSLFCVTNLLCASVCHAVGAAAGVGNEGRRREMERRLEFTMISLSPSFQGEYSLLLLLLRPLPILKTSIFCCRSSTREQADISIACLPLN